MIKSVLHRRRRFWAVCLALGMTALSVGLSQTRAQQPQPPQTLDEKGFVEEVSGGAMIAKLDKTLPWQIHVSGETKVTVTGTAEPSYLSSGVLIKFSNEFDDKLTALTKEIEQIEILPPGSKPGVFDSTEKPVHKPKGGTPYEFRQKVSSFKPEANELLVIIGGKKIVAKTSATLAITINSSDINLAQQGDAVAVKGHYDPQYKPNPQAQTPGVVQAETLTVTLAKPLVGNVKKTKGPAAKAGRGTKTPAVPAAPAEAEVRNPFSK